MSFFDGVDFENKSVEQVEAVMAADGRIPPGFYRAILHGAKEITSASKGTPGCELTFKIKGGMFNDRPSATHFGKQSPSDCKIESHYSGCDWAYWLATQRAAK